MGAAAYNRGSRIATRAADACMPAANARAERQARKGAAERPARRVPSLPDPRSPFAVGQRVRCTVHGAEGECTVTDVGTDRRRGYIKISNFRAWCPAHNFKAVQ